MTPTRGMAPDHRRHLLAHRASERTRRRALLLIASVTPTIDPDPALVARLDLLVGEADRLWERLAGLPEAEARMRQAWRTNTAVAA